MSIIGGQPYRPTLKTPEINLSSPTQTQQAQEFDEYAWLDQLTPIQSYAQATQSPQSAPIDPPASHSPTSSIDYSRFDEVDEVVVKELDEKLVSPALSALRQELKELKEQRALEEQIRINSVQKRVDVELDAHNPRSRQILRSNEFFEYLNSKRQKYSRESPVDILYAAYNSGDAEYVKEQIDGFISSRTKGRAPIGIEPQRGRGSSVANHTPRAKKMTAEQYEEKRRQIKSSPKGTYPPDALAKLAEEFSKNGDYT